MDKKIDIFLEGNTATWELRKEGEIYGTYAGSFRFRCFLTPTQILAAGRQQRELLGQNLSLVPEREDQLAWALSQLNQRIITAPPFWTSTVQSTGIAGDLPDEAIVWEVLDASIEAEAKYKENLNRKKLDAIKKSKEIAEKMVLNKVGKEEPETDE